MDKIDLRSLSADEMRELAIELGFERYRGTQVFEWINKKFVDGFEQMSNIPKNFRDMLDKAAYISNVRIAEVVDSGGAPAAQTKKYLFELGNNTIIENVSMKYSFGNSCCISSQAGCKMGCVFCASASDGFFRNLSAGEMCASVYEIGKHIGARISNIVIMGSGEPFDNYDNVMKFLRIVTSAEGLGIGRRHVTVSTCGIVPRIKDFTDEGTQVNLAVSLHAPDDGIRRNLMPIAKKYSIEEIINICSYYSDKTGRRVTYEYALAAGINDSPDCAVRLAQMLKQRLCHVNLIPLNNVKGARGQFIGSDAGTARAFARILESHGVPVTVRRKLGSDVNASCGQLVYYHYRQD